MAYVYILSEYEEHGAENVHATNSRNNLFSIILNYGENKDLTLEMDALQNLLKKSDEDLSKKRSGHKLCGGWGGATLHVIELE